MPRSHSVTHTVYVETTARCLELVARMHDRVPRGAGERQTTTVEPFRASALSSAHSEGDPPTTLTVSRDALSRHLHGGEGGAHVGDDDDDDVDFR